MTLKSADGRFQLTAPTGWKLSGSSGEINEIINAEHTKLDLAILVTAKAKAELGDMILAEFTETGRRGQGKDSGNSLSAPESLTVNGYPARQYELKRDKVTCLVTAIESPAHFHWLTACGANVGFAS